MSEEGREKIKTRGVFLALLALAWPTMLEQLMQTAVQYVDTAMVGAVGTDATAAVGATTTVNWLFGNTISAIGVGFLAYISQAIGRGEEGKARAASGQCVFVTIVVGVLFTALALSLSGVVPVLMQVEEPLRRASSRYFFILYTTMLFRTASILFGTVLRAAGDTKTPMLAGAALNFVNIVLNYFLIYPTRTVSLFGNEVLMCGAGWGVEGAAAASAISYMVGGVIVFFVLLFHKKVSFRGQSICPKKEVLFPCMRVALPNMVQRFATSFGYVAFASMINSLGKLSTAAHTVANTVESAFYIPGWGMQTAAATLAGNAYGAGDRETLKRLSFVSVCFETALMVLSGGLLFAFAPQLVSLFSKDGEVISLGATVLRMVALSEPFYGIAIVLEGIMQGMGKTRLPFVYNVVGMWGVRIAGTAVCVALGHGLVSAWGCMIAHNVMLFVAFAITFLVRMRKGKE